MFIGRENELADLNDMYNQNKFQLFVLYGLNWRDSPFRTPRDNEGLPHRRGKAIPAPLWARQLRRFLETASLFPPPAALRRFPLDPRTANTKIYFSSKAVRRL